MTALEKMRDAFESCTVMAGVDPDFECIYITKAAADMLFDEAEAEYAKLREQLQDAEYEESVAWDRVRAAERRNDELRELVRIMHGELVSCEDNGYVCGGHKFDERMRELGIEV